MREEVGEVSGTRAMELVNGNVVLGAGVIGLTADNKDSVVPEELAPEGEVVPKGIDDSEIAVIPAEDEALSIEVEEAELEVEVVENGREVLIVDAPDVGEGAACVPFDSGGVLGGGVLGVLDKGLPVGDLAGDFPGPPGR